MKDIFKYGLIAAALYFGVNWAADHPRHVKAFCKQMNQTVEMVLTTTKNAINDGANEVASQTE